MSIPVFTSSYSISKSILTLDKSVEITDHSPISIFSIAKKHKLNKIFLAEDNMCGFYEAYSNSKSYNIQLCFGLNINVVNNLESEDGGSVVTIWIKNSNGYEDLLKINSFANKEGYKHPVPRVDWKTLNLLYTKNLVVTIPFYSGFLFQNLTNLDSNNIPVFDSFDPIFFVNSQGLPWDEELSDITIKYAQENKYKYFNSHQIYYYTDSDVEALQVLRCLNQRSSFEKPELSHFVSDKFSFTSLHQTDNSDFEDLFSIYSIDKLTNGVRLPQINIPDNERNKIGISKDASNLEYLTALTKAGLKEKIFLQNNLSKEERCKYIDRCKMELDTFKRLHLVDYILLVRDFLAWSKDENIILGRARGSSAGSLVAYLIGITNVDSLKYGLYFSRFISEARAQSKEIDGIIYLNGSTLSDIDSDISYKDRHKVIEYIQKKHEGKTAKIGTTTTLTGKILIKEISKILLNYSETDAQHISESIDKIFGTILDLSKAYDQKGNFQKWVDSSEDNKNAYRIALKLENLIRNRGQHPSGIAVSYYDIDTLVPLIRSSDGSEIVTAYDMKAVANLLVKCDVLGIKTLDCIKETCELAGIDYNNIDPHHESIYKYLNNSEHYHGLFQIEKGLGKNTVLSVKPKTLDDYSACVALGRPGSMKFIPDYVKFKETGEIMSYHPKIDKFLQRTGGIIIYQEQINEICEHVYGLSGKDADQIRYCIGKKLSDKIKEWEPILYAQGEKLGIDVSVTDKFWSTCNASADYLFNASHSVSYAILSATTAYLKANYPLEFFTALLRMAKNEPNPMEEISLIQRELAYFGISLLPPSIKDSSEDFIIEGKNIRFGLSSIKGISHAAINRLASFNRKYSNKFDLFNKCLESKLGLGVVSSLIHAGCFPDYNISRCKLLLEFQVYNFLTIRERSLLEKYAEKNQEDLFAGLKYIKTAKDEKGKELIKASRMQTIRKKYDTYFKIYQFNKSHGKILSFLEEMEVLGYSYSGNLADIYKAEFPEVTSIQEALGDLQGNKNTFIGIVADIKEGKSREKKTPYVSLLIQDNNSEIKAMAFNDKMKFFQDDKDKNVEKGSIVICKGTRMSEKTYFIDYAKVLWDIRLAKRVNQVVEKEDLFYVKEQIANIHDKNY